MFRPSPKGGCNQLAVMAVVAVMAVMAVITSLDFIYATCW
jgi:hypothetical protein